MKKNIIIDVDILMTTSCISIISVHGGYDITEFFCPVLLEFLKRVIDEFERNRTLSSFVDRFFDELIFDRMSFRPYGMTQLIGLAT